MVRGPMSTIDEPLTLIDVGSHATPSTVTPKVAVFSGGRTAPRGSSYRRIRRSPLAGTSTLTRTGGVWSTVDPFVTARPVTVAAGLFDGSLTAELSLMYV